VSFIFSQPQQLIDTLVHTLPHCCSVTHTHTHTHTPVYRDQALVLSQADSDVKRNEALNEASCLIVWNVALKVYGERNGL